MKRMFVSCAIATLVTPFLVLFMIAFGYSFVESISAICLLALVFWLCTWGIFDAPIEAFASAISFFPLLAMYSYIQKENSLFIITLILFGTIFCFLFNEIEKERKIGYMYLISCLSVQVFVISVFLALLTMLQT